MMIPEPAKKETGHNRQTSWPGWLFLGAAGGLLAVAGFSLLNHSSPVINSDDGNATKSSPLPPPTAVTQPKTSDTAPASEPSEPQGIEPSPGESPDAIPQPIPYWFQSLHRGSIFSRAGLLLPFISRVVKLRSHLLPVTTIRVRKGRSPNDHVLGVQH